MGFYTHRNQEAISVSGRFLDGEEKQKIRRSRMRRKLAASTVTQALTGLIIAAVILLNLFTHVLQVVRYNGRGMEPSLRSGQTLMLHRTQEVEAGDIIAFYYNNQILVRRVICTGGQQISISQEGQVSVNSQLLEEPYLKERSLGQCNLSFPYMIQKDHVFVMGDNRAMAMDSRLQEIGPVSIERIIGKVLFAI